MNLIRNFISSLKSPFLASLKSKFFGHVLYTWRLKFIFRATQKNQFLQAKQVPKEVQ